jgi:CheY-like chemotaxis protein
MAVLLIAEDDADVRTVLRIVLSRAGFSVHTADDGAAALDLARTVRPDVVLTDLDMPRMTGAQLCRAIRAEPALADIPVAVLSGRVQPGDPRLDGAELCGVLTKPFGNAALVAAVRKLVDRGRHDHTGRPSECPMVG